MSSITQLVSALSITAIRTSTSPGGHSLARLFHPLPPLVVTAAWKMLPQLYRENLIVMVIANLWTAEHTEPWTRNFLVLGITILSRYHFPTIRFEKIVAWWLESLNKKIYKCNFKYQSYNGIRLGAEQTFRRPTQQKKAGSELPAHCGSIQSGISPAEHPYFNEMTILPRSASACSFRSWAARSSARRS